MTIRDLLCTKAIKKMSKEDLKYLKRDIKIIKNMISSEKLFRDYKNSNF